MKLFGTDGIRGKANRYPMTPEIALKVGKAVGFVFGNTKDSKGKIVLGKDTRISGYIFEAALVSGICAMGADVYLLGPMPTPGIAFLTKDMRADAGIVVSASHNPYWDNGIKIFTEDGKKLDDELEERIEKLVLEKEIEGNPDKMGKAKRIVDALGRYVVHLKQSFPENRKLEKLKIVVDCANGATYKVAPMVFSELDAQVISINCEPDGYNINHRCGAVHPEGMREKVIETGADVGVAFDGDGDRVILSDEKGNILDGDDILAICGCELKKRGALPKNVVVSTIMANKGLEIALKRENIDLIRTKVGDRFVYEKMIETGSIIGGEPSGHVIFLRYSNTGDGIITALQVLAIMLETGLTLSELVQKRSVKFPKKEMSVDVREKIPFENTPFGRVIEKVKKACDKNNARIVVRYSGTENKLRILVEGEDEEFVKRHAELLAEEARKHFGREV